MNKGKISEYGCSCDVETATCSGEEIIGLVQKIRSELGESSVLLDTYMAGLLKAIHATADISWIVDEGYHGALAELRGMCLKIRDGKEDDVKAHPFFPKIKAFMDAHNIEKGSLFVETHCVALFAEYSEYAARRFTIELDCNWQKALKENGVPEARAALCAVIGMDETENLEARIINNIIKVSLPTLYMQGMLHQLTMSMIMPDRRGGDYFVFQYLADNNI